MNFSFTKLQFLIPSVALIGVVAACNSGNGTGAGGATSTATSTSSTKAATTTTTTGTGTGTTTATATSTTTATGTGTTTVTGSTGTGSTPCQAACDHGTQLSMQLNCAPEAADCVSSCEQGVAAAGNCVQQFNALVNCAATVMASQCMCDPQNQNALKCGNACQTEQAAFAACASMGTGTGTGTTTAAGGG